MDVKNSNNNKNNNDENINVEELEELRLKSRRDSKLWFCFYFYLSSARGICGVPDESRERMGCYLIWAQVVGILVK